MSGKEFGSLHALTRGMVITNSTMMMNLLTPMQANLPYYQTMYGIKRPLNDSKPNTTSSFNM